MKKFIQYQRIADNLFATEEEMTTQNFSIATKSRIQRCRELYLYWVRYPNLSEREIISELKRRYLLKHTQAYEDLKVIQYVIGELQTHTKNYDDFKFRNMLEESYQLAKEKGEAGTMAKIAATYAKYAKLDKDEVEQIDYSQIIPAQFEITTDPSEIGITPIENWREVAKKLERKLLLDKEHKE